MKCEATGFVIPADEVAAIGRRLQRFGYANYAAYRVSPVWKNKRGRLFKKAGGQCEVCGEPATVPHHRTYALICREPLHHLVALCDSCHKGSHDLVDRKRVPLLIAHLIYAGEAGFRLPISKEEQRRLIGSHYRKEKAAREHAKHKKAMRKRRKSPPRPKSKLTLLNEQLHQQQVENAKRREANRRNRAA